MNNTFCGLFSGSSTSKLWLVSSTPGACNFTEYTVQHVQDFAKFWKQLSLNKMIRQKIAANIISSIRNNLLQCQYYSVASRFEVFSNSSSFLYLVVAKFDNCSLSSLTRSQCLAHAHWISGCYILVVKHLTKFTVEANCQFKSL